MRIQRILMICLMSAALLQACAQEIPKAAAGVIASNAWIRSGPPSASVLAAYLDVHNATAQAWTVLELSSPAFEHIEMHSTQMENGMMRMRPMSNVVIAPSGTLHFVPGGDHLMLMQPRTLMTDGIDVPIVLKLRAADGAILTLTINARVGNAGVTHEH